MDKICPQLEGFLPVVVDDQLTTIAGTELQALGDFATDAFGSGILEPELNGLDPERHQASQPIDIGNNGIEGVEGAGGHQDLSRPKKGVPATGVDGVAVSRISINPASKAVRPAAMAAAKAPAMRTGSAARATAVLSRTASNPISIVAAACDGAPMPASIISGVSGK